MPRKRDSNFSINMFNTCPRRYYYQYVRREPGLNEPKPYFIVGSIVHAGLERALRMHKQGDHVKHAVEGAKRYREEGLTAAHLGKAIEVLEAYVPVLGIGDTIVPYIHDGKPAVELELSYEYADGVRVGGKIDAIVQHKDGRVLLVDWKVRSGLIDIDTVQRDRQLYLYADLALRNGIEIDGALQVQMSKNTPSDIRFKPSLETDKEFASAVMANGLRGYAPDDVLDMRMGYITQETVTRFLDDYSIPADERQMWMLHLFEKVVDSTRFIKYTPVDLAKRDSFIRDMLLTLKDIHGNYESNEWRRVDSMYTCNSCKFRKVCR